MRKIIVEEWISLDGYVSDKQGKLDFFTSTVRDAYADTRQVKFLESIDCILFGRKTYELFAARWPERPIDNDPLAEKINKGKKIVFSNTLTKAPWGKWPDAEVAGDDPVSTIKQLKLLPGNNIVIWGSL